MREQQEQLQELQQQLQQLQQLHAQSSSRWRQKLRVYKQLSQSLRAKHCHLQQEKSVLLQHIKSIRQEGGAALSQVLAAANGPLLSPMERHELLLLKQQQQQQQQGSFGDPAMCTDTEEEMSSRENSASF